MKYAAENKYSLIVGGIGNEAEITSSFPGAFAEQIINQSNIPVLTCKGIQSHYVVGIPRVLELSNVLH